jgi:triosephosphate isomerase
MRKKLIAGNWKMNGSLAANATLLDGLRSGSEVGCELAVCVPVAYLSQTQAALTGSAIAWGAQDVSEHDTGAYTGEISAAMLKDFACHFVIVGHSERRTYHLESDELVASKAVQALKSGLIPIVCVGETLQERENGQTDAVVIRQLQPVIAALASRLSEIVIAYEPVWAIGTGKTATPEMAQQVHAVIRAALARADTTAANTIRILYGGSMKPDNAKELLAMADIDGGLIGGASLKAADFLAIAAAA